MGPGVTALLAHQVGHQVAFTESLEPAIDSGTRNTSLLRCLIYFGNRPHAGIKQRLDRQVFFLGGIEAARRNSIQILVATSSRGNLATQTVHVYNFDFARIHVAQRHMRWRLEAADKVVSAIVELHDGSHGNLSDTSHDGAASIWVPERICLKNDGIDSATRA